MFDIEYLSTSSKIFIEDYSDKENVSFGADRQSEAETVLSDMKV